MITDDLIIDYINRFYIMDVDARIQLFDLKSKYQFQTVPAVDKYNMPLYDFQTEQTSQSIGMYPVYQGFQGPAYINGVQVPFYTQRSEFFNTWPNVTQNITNLGTGDGVTTNFSFTIPVLGNTTPPNPPTNGLIRGHVDLSGIIATGVNQDPPIASTLNTAIPSTSIDSAVFITTQDQSGGNLIVQDSGQFLSLNVDYGLLMSMGTAPFGYSALSGGYTTTENTINYLTGATNVTFPRPPASGALINAQVLYFQSGLPRGFLYYNNTITLRSPPSQQWLVEVDGYLSPAAFLTSSAALPYAYMAEYIARGAARKILSDTGDIEQFMFYEPLFKEQESLVWKRSQRQFTSTRTQTIYSQNMNQGIYGYSNMGAATQ